MDNISLRLLYHDYNVTCFRAMYDYWYWQENDLFLTVFDYFSCEGERRQEFVQTTDLRTMRPRRCVSSQNTNTGLPSTLRTPISHSEGSSILFVLSCLRRRWWWPRVKIIAVKRWWIGDLCMTRLPKWYIESLMMCPMLGRRYMNTGDLASCRVGTAKQACFKTAHNLVELPDTADNR